MSPNESPLTAEDNIQQDFFSQGGLLPDENLDQDAAGATTPPH